MKFKILLISLLFSSVIYAAKDTKLVNVTVTPADLPTLTQESQHKVASQRLTTLLLRSHYHRFNLDNAMSEKIYNQYLDMLDYNKVIFTKQDVEKFDNYKYKFKDMLLSGELKPIYDIYELYQQNRLEQYNYMLSLLDKEMDFNVPNDKYEFDRKDTSWVDTKAQLQELWRQRVKYDELNLKLADKNVEEIKTLLTKRYKAGVTRLTKANSEDVFQIAMNSLTRSIDPHTSYLSPVNADSFAVEMNLSLEGIGAVLSTVDDYTVIKSLVAGSPAEKSKKLRPEDKIIGVAQGKDKMIDIVGWRIDDVVNLIKGKKGSHVRLQILPAKTNGKMFEVELVRDTIRLEDQAAKSSIIDVEGKKIGIINVPSFYVNLSRDVEKELVKLNKENISGLVMDLRNDGGGALNEARLLSGLFIKSGPIVQIRNANGDIGEDSDVDDAVYYSGPMTVLINRYSASASEIFAAAMQDYDRAVILGETSFGKGTVQQHKSLGRMYDMFPKPLGHVQYTMAKFYRINGGSTQIKGVTPDILFPTALAVGEYGESEEKNALPWDKIAPANYKPVATITSSIISDLTKRHEARKGNNLEFGFINEEIAEAKKLKESKTISLVEKERIAIKDADEERELKRLNYRRSKENLPPLASLDDKNKEKAKEKEKAKMMHGMGMKKDSNAEDVYLQEAAKITLDLANTGLMFFDKNVKIATKILAPAKDNF